jgi:DNA-binding Lrp family transcriptional regulator
MDNQIVKDNSSASPELLVLKFADSRVPIFKEERNKDYIKYGEKNDYPDYLTYLFNKSSKNNAIITGKADYIFGGGFENGNFIVNQLEESLNDVAAKCILDVEIFGGFYLEVIYNYKGQICEVYHVDYSCLRKGKEKGYYYKENWNLLNKEQERYIEEFNHVNRTGSQIYAYYEYRPNVRYYPLPMYIGCNNYIETDIEISKYYLSCIRNGMMPSKMIQFFTGEPTDDKKREIEARLEKKFSGSENAGKFFMVFNGNANNKAVQIDDLSASDLDKHMDGLNKLCGQEIFSGHKIVSPMLFGIKTEGQLGGVTELKTSYEAFVNTYAKPKANKISKEITFVLGFSIWGNQQYELTQIDPIGIQFDVKDVINSLPKEYVFEKLGIPKDMWALPNIGGDNKPSQGVVQAENEQPTAQVNDSIRNLTTKQHQQVMRIIRQYSKGQLTESAAKAMLRTGYGLEESDINDLLGIQPIAAMKFEEQEIAILGMFDSCGESKQDFEIIKSKRTGFTTIEEAKEDEAIYIHEAFKTVADLTVTESKILELIKKDPKITPKVIAETIGQTVSYVESKLKQFEAKGYIEATTTTIGEDVEIVRKVPPSAEIPPIKKNPLTTVKIMYSYEGPEDSRNRPFCAKMMQLDRLYTRKDIETISEKLGYSVFDRRGGFWRHKDGLITPYCRHRWQSNIVVKK